MSTSEEAITSSQLEGASTTRRVAEAMLREGRKPRDRSETMIFNNYQAMNHLRELKDEPITPARILELHRTLTFGTLDDPVDAGRLRRDDTVTTSPALHARLNPRQLELLNHSLRNPGEAYRMDGHQRAHQVAYQTARTDLLGLEAMELLQRVKRGNAYVFYAPEDLRERIERLAREVDAG